MFVQYQSTMVTTILFWPTNKNGLGIAAESVYLHEAKLSVSSYVSSLWTLRTLFNVELNGLANL
jgi:hypothetical protein